MNFKSTLNQTLTERFTDRDEILDVTAHGCSAGVGGFIYTYEINEFFNEFENEIENYFYEIFGDTWMKDSGAADCDSMDSIRTHLVWSLVEMWCYDKLDDMEEEMEAA